MNEYKEFAIDFARRAGVIMKENFSLGMSKEWKKDNTPVTETDLRINALLIEEIASKFPDHSVRSEEESNSREGSLYTWVCDPVDGTIPFAHGIPISTFSLALVREGESTLGVVYDPFEDRLFSATKGEGAFLNGKPITVSQQNQLKGAVANYEMFENAYFDINDLATHLSMKEGVKMLKLNSVIYPTVLVAAGELAFCIFPHNTAHDAAAIKVIVEEAGGKVTDLFGKEQRYDRETRGFIASNGILHENLLELSLKMVSEK